MERSVELTELQSGWSKFGYGKVTLICAAKKHKKTQRMNQNALRICSLTED